MNEPNSGDIAALAKGGRQNFVGFLVRLVGMLPFLFIAGRLYGAAALGRYASALVVVEIIGLVCSMGEKRGLAQRLTEGSDAHPSNIVFDGMLVATLTGFAAAAFFWLVPAPLFPSGQYTQLDLLIVLAIPGYALTEIVLAAQAYRFDIATTVRARSIVLPWTLSILAGVFYFVIPESGLTMAYLASIYAGLLTGLWSFLRTYGLPKGWRPRPRVMWQMTVRALPLATADAIEWGTRRLDIFILGLFAAPSVVGIYYVAQQVASLPQKLKTSFEPILGPVITRALKIQDYAAIARQVCQVGFWITAVQGAVALALGIPGEAIMGLVGPNFVGGTAALGFLLAAEVAASTAVVAEAALIYVARIKNLVVSLATIGLQAGLTVAAMLVIRAQGLPDAWLGAAAAAALMLALGASSLTKAIMLSRILERPINNWRWALVWAAAAAVLVGQVAIMLPEWAELVFGVPAILGAYGWIIWRRGFGPEDRILFRRQAVPAASAVSTDPPVNG